MGSSSLNRDYGKIGVFIDGNNLFHAARSIGIEIDYTKLLKNFNRYGIILRAFFYTGVDENASKQQGFLLWMKRNGYKVIQKELKIYPDGSKRANLDVEITVDMLNLSQYVDTIVLVSGDEGFAYALNYLSERGKQIILTGFRANTSPALMDSTDDFFDLESSLSEIVKKSSNNFSPEISSSSASSAEIINSEFQQSRRSFEPSSPSSRIIKRKEKRDFIE